MISHGIYWPSPNRIYSVLILNGVEKNKFVANKMENDFKGKTYVITGAGRGRNLAN